MKNSQNFERNLSVKTIDERGGEPLEGSGFETEEPEPGFSDAAYEGEE